MLMVRAGKVAVRALLCTSCLRLQQNPPISILLYYRALIDNWRLPVCARAGLDAAAGQKRVGDNATNAV